MNLTRIQVAGLLEGIKPELHITQAVAKVCPARNAGGQASLEDLTVKVQNLGDGRARDIKLIFKVRFQDDADFRLLAAEWIPSTSDLPSREVMSIAGTGITGWFVKQLQEGQAPLTTDQLARIRNIIVSSKYRDLVGTNYSSRQRGVDSVPCR